MLITSASPFSHKPRVDMNSTRIFDLHRFFGSIKDHPHLLELIVAGDFEVYNTVQYSQGSYFQSNPHTQEEEFFLSAAPATPRGQSLPITPPDSIMEYPPGLKLTILPLTTLSICCARGTPPLWLYNIFLIPTLRCLAMSDVSGCV